MINVVGVRFKQVGKIYYFDPEGLTIQAGTPVIVETTRGVEYGIAEIGNREVEESTVVLPLKRVVRTATEADIRQEKQNKEREKEAFGICIEKIKAHNLDMKLIEVELTFDLSKIIFYFTSEGRVDFRELVKDLAAVFRMRIELRQIGVRDEAKMMSGIGICGKTLCCATFLSDFQPVSIKMAKEQSLSLNPAKISGICGRLMCCLKYEEETYEKLNKGMPGVGDIIQTPDGEGEVLSVNILRQQIKATVRTKKSDDPSVNYYPAKDIKIIKKRPQEPEINA